jgi:hypothetical protein
MSVFARRGAYVPITVNLSATVYEELDQLAREQLTSKGQLIRHFLQRALAEANAREAALHAAWRDPRPRRVTSKVSR